MQSITPLQPELTEPLSKSFVINSYLQYYQDSPLITVAATIVAAVVLLWLLGKATKLAIGILVLVAVVIGVSYFIDGEEATKKRIDDVQKSVEKHLGEPDAEDGK